MLKQFVIGAALLAGLSHAAPARAQAPPAAQPPAEAPKPNNYADPKSWLCRPGSHDACDIDETATVVAADGTLTRETWKADPNAAIDCFYVYPTISTDPGQNSDMIADPAEINVVKQQFARFSSKCRPVRAALPADHARRPAQGARQPQRRAALRRGRAVRRRARCVELLPARTTTRDAASCWSGTRRDRSS